MRQQAVPRRFLCLAAVLNGEGHNFGRLIPQRPKFFCDQRKRKGIEGFFISLFVKYFAVPLIKIQDIDRDSPIRKIIPDLKIIDADAVLTEKGIAVLKTAALLQRKLPVPRVKIEIPAGTN